MALHWARGEADVAAMLAAGGWSALPSGPGVWSFDATASAAK